MRHRRFLSCCSLYGIQDIFRKFGKLTKIGNTFWTQTKEVCSSSYFLPQFERPIRTSSGPEEKSLVWHDDLSTRQWSTQRIGSFHAVYRFYRVAEAHKTDMIPMRECGELQKRNLGLDGGFFFNLLTAVGPHIDRVILWVICLLTMV